MLRTSWLARAAVAITAAAAVSIAGSPAIAATTTPAHHLRTFTLKDKGRTISLREHHKIKLDLRTDADGGFHWVLVKHSNFTLVRKASHPYKHKKGVTGYPVHTIYVLRATDLGKGSVIRLVERGPSGKKSDIGRRFKLTVNVH
jgi:predicted secreted protein